MEQILASDVEKLQYQNQLSLVKQGQDKTQFYDLIYLITVNRCFC